MVDAVQTEKMIMLTKIGNCIRELTGSTSHKYKSPAPYNMAETNKPVVEKEDHDEDKSEVLGNLVKVVVLIWSASLLTFSYVRLPNGQKILDFDPTFIASVFSGSLAAFGLSPAKNGSTPKKAPSIGKKEKDNAESN